MCRSVRCFIWFELMFCVCFFKQKTAYEMRISDWSSDVCSSDLLTSRLVQVMAWLLVQKAVHAGEIEDTDVDDPKRRLGGHEICAEPGPWDVSGLPKGLRGLLDRSLALYNRVARLDEMVHIRASQERERAAGETADERTGDSRSEEHTSELQSLLRISY